MAIEQGLEALLDKIGDAFNDAVRLNEQAEGNIRNVIIAIDKLNIAYAHIEKELKNNLVE